MSLGLGCPSAAPRPTFSPSASGFPPMHDSPHLCPRYSHTSSAMSSFPGPSCLRMARYMKGLLSALVKTLETGCKRDHAHNKFKVSPSNPTCHRTLEPVPSCHRTLSPVSISVPSPGWPCGRRTGPGAQGWVGTGNQPQAQAQIWLPHSETLVSSGSSLGNGSRPLTAQGQGSHGGRQDGEEPARGKWQRPGWLV